VLPKELFNARPGVRGGIGVGFSTGNAQQGSKHWATSLVGVHEGVAGIGVFLYIVLNLLFC
jgi:hypothetical protein